MRRNLSAYALLAAAVTLLLPAGCGRRFDPVAPATTGAEGDISTSAMDFSPTGSDLLPRPGDGLSQTESPLRTWKTYRPPGYREEGQGEPYPVLFLLLDFGGNGLPDAAVDEDYYFEIGLRRIADSMINAGVIQPMLIATIDLYNAYGGSWYTSNDVQGLYAHAFVEFVGYVDDAFNTLSSEAGRRARGISGVGMGGYGAMILVMQRPDLFASASSVNGHLAFAQTSETYNFHGVKDWVPRVFEENFVTPVSADYPIENGMALLPYYSMTPDITDPLRKPYTNLVFSMAAAFSPFDGTTATWGDSITWMNPANAGGDTKNWKVSMPFLWNGDIWPDVYGRWLAYDATEFLLNFPAQLANVQVYIEAGTTAEFGILAQNRIFHDAAIARGLSTLRYEEFDGYDGYPTTRRHLLTERLREVLKFHSDNLASAVPSN